MNLMNAIEEGYKKEVPPFQVGDTVKVFVKVVEGDKERIQPFEGIVIARRTVAKYRTELNILPSNLRKVY